MAVAGLDHIGIERALREELGALHIRRGLLEDLDEAVADQPALLLRIGDAGQVAQEVVACVDDAEVDLEVVDEGVLDEVALLLAEQAVVDEDAGQPVADGLVQERGDDG